MPLRHGVKPWPDVGIKLGLDPHGRSERRRLDAEDPSIEVSRPPPDRSRRYRYQVGDEWLSEEETIPDAGVAKRRKGVRGAALGSQ
jgi:hypothetical protein